MTTEKDASLAAWLDDWIQKPVKEPKKPIAPSVLRIANESTFNALVLFINVNQCACGACSRSVRYVGLRRRIKNGHVYIAYTPGMTGIASQLPRLIIETPLNVPFCESCFAGAPVDDNLPSEQFYTSRVTSEDDLAFFIRKSAQVSFEESYVSEQASKIHD